jgi:hypothetical protein
MVYGNVIRLSPSNVTFIPVAGLVDIPVGSQLWQDIGTFPNTYAMGMIVIKNITQHNPISNFLRVSKKFEHLDADV